MSDNSAATVFDRVRNWPEERRKEAERMLEAMEAAGPEIYHLSPEERALVEEGLDEAKRGDLVSDDEMEAFWRRHDK